MIVTDGLQHAARAVLLFGVVYSSIVQSQDTSSAPDNDTQPESSSEQSKPESAPAGSGGTFFPIGSYAIQKSFDPGAYTTMFNLMANNPELVQNPTAICVQCHEGEAISRYQQTLFPMLQLMTNPAMWGNPNAYMNAVVPMMNPQTYFDWMNAMYKAMGSTVAPITESAEQ